MRDKAFSLATSYARKTADNILGAAVDRFKANPTSDARFVVDHAMRACMAAAELERVSDEAFMAEVEIVDRALAEAGRLLATRCPSCGTPTHASESDDDGRCVPCMRAAGVEPITPNEEV